MVKFTKNKEFNGKFQFLSFFFGWTAGPLRVIIDADNECELNYFGNIIARISAQSQRPKETKPADCEGGLGTRPRRVHA
jgi:hypothetical protein